MGAFQTTAFPKYSTRGRYSSKINPDKFEPHEESALAPSLDYLESDTKNLALVIRFPEPAFYIVSENGLRYCDCCSPFSYNAVYHNKKGTGLS